MLKLRGARNLIVSDLSDHRLDIAKGLGAKFTINPKNEEFLSRIEEITENAKVDISIEAVGFTASVSHALNALKNRGTNVWVGMAHKMIEVNMHQIVTSELNVKGSFIYSENDFVDSKKLIEAGKIQLDPIITYSEALENGVDAFDSLKNNKDGKILKIVLQND